MILNMPMIFFVYKEAFFNSNDLDSCVPSVVKVLLQEFKDVFLDDIPSGLPPIRGIEHQIDFVPEHLYQIGRLIGAILKRLRSFKGKWGS